MKIVCFIDHLGPGGAQRQITSLAVLFKERGHYVELLTYYPNDFFLSILERAGIPVCCINEANPIRRINRVRRILRRGNQDAVLSFLDTPNFIACCSAIGGRKWSLVVGERSARLRSFTNSKDKLFRMANVFADHIVCNSYNAQRIWLNYLPVFGAKLHTLYNPVIINDGQINYGYKPKRDGKLHLVVAAGYRRLKNMAGLVTAVNLLDSEYRKQLVIEWYGDIDDYEGSAPFDETIAKIREYNLQENIFLHPATKDILSIMAQADVVGLFSHYEGLPNVICEGMTLGKPIIMSRVSDFDYLVDERNGFLCNANDPESIAAAICALIDMPIAELVRMGDASQAKSKALFDKTAIIDSYLNLLQCRQNYGQ